MSSEDPDNPALCIPYIAYRQNLFWKNRELSRKINILMMLLR